MTVKECYEQMDSNYNNVLERLGSESLVKRFALKFKDDLSFANLTNALEAGDAPEAFRAAHSLKGICLNLGLDELYEASAALTELLRGKDTVQGYEELYKELKDQYDITLAAVAGMQE